jgi:hypothetical protein
MSRRARNGAIGLPCTRSCVRGGRREGRRPSRLSSYDLGQAASACCCAAAGTCALTICWQSCASRLVSPVPWLLVAGSPQAAASASARVDPAEVGSPAAEPACWICCLHRAAAYASAPLLAAAGNWCSAAFQFVLHSAVRFLLGHGASLSDPPGPCTGRGGSGPSFSRAGWERGAVDVLLAGVVQADADVMGLVLRPGGGHDAVSPCGGW